ncbi:hypothetical protein AB0A81_26530 [Streptomyces flaveolus]|uniref:Uncharacterized protein n=1 Tax=Streptomyces flaveolus TaxID=67297 RepID=A0ABV1VBC8_9ACTN
MTITMRSYGFTWTDADGTPRAAAVAYDEVSADRRRDELEKAGATGIVGTGSPPHRPFGLGKRGGTSGLKRDRPTTTGVAWRGGQLHTRPA